MQSSSGDVGRVREQRDERHRGERRGRAEARDRAGRARMAGRARSSSGPPTRPPACRLLVLLAFLAGFSSGCSVVSSLTAAPSSRGHRASAVETRAAPEPDAVQRSSSRSRSASATTPPIVEASSSATGRTPFTRTAPASVAYAQLASSAVAPEGRTRWRSWAGSSASSSAVRARRASSPGTMVGAIATSRSGRPSRGSARRTSSTSSAMPTETAASSVCVASDDGGANAVEAERGDGQPDARVAGAQRGGDLGRTRALGAGEHEHAALGLPAERRLQSLGERVADDVAQRRVRRERAGVQHGVTDELVGVGLGEAGLAERTLDVRLVVDGRLVELVARPAPRRRRRCAARGLRRQDERDELLGHGRHVLGAGRAGQREQLGERQLGRRARAAARRVPCALA